MLSVDIAGRIGEFDLSATFEAASGVTALVGPSGAGKSLILRAIGGLWTPQDGAIRLGSTILLDTQTGVDLSPERRRVGAVFQQALLFPHMNVERNLAYGMAKGISDFDTIVELLDLEPLLKRMPRNLSGGEAQRVSIGRALLSEPDVLLLDEPMTGLDEARRMAILPYLQSLYKNLTIPIIYVTHRSDEVAQLAQSVVQIEGGKSRTAESVDEYMRLVETVRINQS